MPKKDRVKHVLILADTRAMAGELVFVLATKILYRPIVDLKKAPANLRLIVNLRNGNGCAPEARMKAAAKRFPAISILDVSRQPPSQLKTYDCATVTMRDPSMRDLLDQIGIMTMQKRGPKPW